MPVPPPAEAAVGAGMVGLARRWTRGGDVRNVWFEPASGEGPAAGGGGLLRAERARAAKHLGAAAVLIAAAVADATAQEATVPAIVERVGEAAEQDEARRVALEYLAGQVEQVIVRLGEIETQNEILRAEKETLERQLGEMTTAHRSLEQAHDTATREKRGEIEALQGRLTALKADLDGERRLRDALRTERDRLAGRLDATSNAYGALERALESSEQRAAEQLAGLRHQLAALTVELEDERAVRDALARQGDEMTETVAALSRERARLSAALNEAQGTIGGHRSVADSQRSEIDRLSRHVAALRADLKALKEALAASQVRAEDQDETIEDLGRRLNTALAARVQQLARHRSEFFGRLREALSNRADVRIAGDRFVLQSELLFPSGSAQIGPAGRTELVRLGAALKRLAGLIPEDIDWILRVDGHTDRVPIVTDDFSSNWELSTARAVAVVEFLVAQGIAPHRLAAAGFGEFQPLDDREDEIGYRRNRRIEFKLTQR